MKNRQVQLAAAAVVLIALLIGINHFGGSIDGTSVAWGDVVVRLDKVDSYSSRMKQVQWVAGTKMATEMLMSWSRQYGCRMDTLAEDDTVSFTLCIPVDGSEILTLDHSSKTYRRERLSQEESGGQTAYIDPREAVKKVISFQHKKLGAKRISGVLAEGIQVNDPTLVSASAVKDGGKPVKQMVKRVDAKLWVDVATQLPVLFEVKSETQDGNRAHQIIDQYTWDLQHDETFFRPDIPDDYVERER